MEIHISAGHAMDRDMKLLCTVTKHGLNLPLHARLSIDGQVMTVLGLAKQEERDGQIWQWWIVAEECCGSIQKQLNKEVIKKRDVLD